MSDLLIRTPGAMLRKEPAQRLLGDSNSQFYVKAKDGLVTRGVKIGGRVVAWPEEELIAIRTARIAGASDDEVRGLVSRLHEAREAAARAIGITPSVPEVREPAQLAAGRARLAKGAR
jgi:prophage regulatory protein